MTLVIMSDDDPTVIGTPLASGLKISWKAFGSACSLSSGSAFVGWFARTLGAGATFVSTDLR